MYLLRVHATACETSLICITSRVLTVAVLVWHRRARHDGELDCAAVARSAEFHAYGRLCVTVSNRGREYGVLLSSLPSQDR